MTDRNNAKRDDDDAIDGSFWTYIRRTRKYSLDSDEEERIDKRQRRVCLKGYGISYDWITQSIWWSSRDGHHWENSDGLFRGVPLDDFKALADHFSETMQKSDIKEYHERERDKPYWDRCHNYSIPDHIFKDSNLPTPEELAGEYDIIYYAGELTQLLGRHSRTAQGTLKLSVETDKDGMSVVGGTVKMHPCMEMIDVIPFGGNYQFVEDSRAQRPGPGEGDDNLGDVTLLTGVITIKVTQPPDGTTTKRYYKPEDEAENWGEMRIFRERVGASIIDQVPRGSWSDQIPEAVHDFSSTQQAEDLNKAHFAKTCSWLHKHTVLDTAAAFQVGRFVCPPPVFFFEPGDIELDIGWNSVVGSGHNCSTCVIARRRAQSDAIRAGRKYLESNEEKFEKAMSVLQSGIDILERQKDATWLAYHCSKLIGTNENDNNPTPSLHLSRSDTRIERCIVYMNEKTFREQLGIYGLQLERKLYSWGEYGGEYVLTFSWI